ncbi:hypothetical protein BDV95DRAFT_485546 [Massariosphaeria phaeospora]|uniref:DUF1772-domain-containing protein n=1 Tax=Massariosphaeria phaeospora TaxID=100035 RepID=A0A7C8IBT4_9PLEO|nr:hypothetical protein BDV95DRAFT_485546 [Massariosphaeria phaeospora]
MDPTLPSPLPYNYVFNLRPPSGVLIAQVVGITTSTFLFAQNAAYSYSTVPAILLAPAPLAARQWSQFYSKGKRIGPALAIVSTLATAYVTYHQFPNSIPFKLNLAAIFIIPSIIPFTFAFLMPTNNALMEKSEALASTALDDKNAEAGVKSGESVHELIDKWGVLNLARAGIVGVGALLTVLAAVHKRQIEVLGSGGFASAPGVSSM